MKARALDRGTLGALDWSTGDSTFHWVIGDQRRNALSPFPDEYGGMMYGIMWSRARIVPKPE